MLLSAFWIIISLKNKKSFMKKSEPVREKAYSSNRRSKVYHLKSASFTRKTFLLKKDSKKTKIVSKSIKVVPAITLIL
jgi:hypothetical protein